MILAPACAPDLSDLIRQEQPQSRRDRLEQLRKQLCSTALPSPSEPPPPSVLPLLGSSKPSIYHFIIAAIKREASRIEPPSESPPWLRRQKRRWYEYMPRCCTTANTSQEHKTGSNSGAESPTTAKELDFEEEAPLPSEPADAPSAPPRSATPKKVSFQGPEAAPPPKPPRPMSPQAQAEATLIEAFPSMDAKVVKAVLVASGGKVEPAFNALLSMTDPESQSDAPAPPQPPRPTQQQRQMEQDERYARQLAAHYQQRAEGYQGYGSRGQGDPPLPPRRAQTGLKPNEMYDDREHSFFDGKTSIDSALYCG